MANIQTKIYPVPWNLAQLWNEVAYKSDRPMVPRDYIYASEIGGPFVDRFYKMKAIPYTNPPNKRSLNKFLAGRIWEYVVKQILISCGVYKHEEIKVDTVPYKNCLAVHGRLDFKAGGYIDQVEALENVSRLHLPDFLYKIAARIIATLSGGYLEEKILEIKAISTFAMDMVERRHCAVPQHSLQAYHYQRPGLIKAEVCYICKDDSRMAQFGIDVDESEKLYKQDIELMTKYFKKNKVPPPEPLVKFDMTLARFSKNLGVEYSPYLTKVYSFASPDDYRKSIKFIDRWNRTLARFAIVECAGKTPTGQLVKITPKNVECKTEINKAGFKFDELLRCKMELGVEEEELET